MWVVCERNKLFFGELWRKVLKTQKYKSKIRNHSVASFYQPSMKRRQIEACIYNCRIIKKKSIFFFSKQKGISCTACEQIGLFLISTRGCGSHSRKYLKNLICSRVQKSLIVSRTDRFFMYKKNCFLKYLGFFFYFFFQI